MIQIRTAVTSRSHYLFGSSARTPAADAGYDAAAKIAQLERLRNSRVILLVRRQETMRLLGFPIARNIDSTIPRRFWRRHGRHQLDRSPAAYCAGRDQARSWAEREQAERTA